MKIEDIDHLLDAIQAALPIGTVAKRDRNLEKVTDPRSPKLFCEACGRELKSAPAVTIACSITGGKLRLGPDCAKRLIRAGYTWDDAEPKEGR